MDYFHLNPHIMCSVLKISISTTYFLYVSYMSHPTNIYLISLNVQGERYKFTNSPFYNFLHSLSRITMKELRYNALVMRAEIEICCY